MSERSERNDESNPDNWEVESASDIDEQDVKLEERRLMRRLSQTVTTIEASVSSVPPPGMLAGYNDAVENGAERMMVMAEVQNTHRIRMERWVILNDIIKSYMGMMLGFGIIVLCLYLGYSLVQDGYKAEGLLVSIPPIVLAVGAYLWTSSDRKNEIHNKPPSSSRSPNISAEERRADELGEGKDRSNENEICNSR